jgi:hypothetical protein
MQSTLTNKEKNFQSCIHRLVDRITTINHEICCKECGLIFDIDNVYEEKTNSTINLFQEVQPGSKPVKIEATTRIHEPKYTSSPFSNACDKLDLPRHVALDAYRIFLKIYKANNMKKLSKKKKQNRNHKFEDKIESANGFKLFHDYETDGKTLTNSEIATYSLFVAIRRFSVLKSSNEVRDAVKFAFVVKKIPQILKIFTKVKPIAIDLGINYDCEDHLEYWINIHLRRYQEKTLCFTNEIKNRVRQVSRTLSGTDEARARLAVKIVLAGSGVRDV